MSCFWVAALLLALHSAAAVGPGSDMDSWMSSMIAKAPKVAKFNSTPSTLAYITTTKRQAALQWHLQQVMQSCLYSATVEQSADG
ncbi:hypothetical protein OEZ86_009115 [Tetradesmus obliquus]|nr:hypothetical protein OEZ86_009115 [Tetradesmus obliquus]